MPERTALVTGSAKGIGRAIAERLAADGFDVIGVDLLQHDDAQVFSKTIAADLESESGCMAVIDNAGHIDVLVNNAALLISVPFEDGNIADLDRQYAVNLRAPILLARAFAPRMARAEWGRVINISSIGVHTGAMTSHTAFYAATKAGLHTLTRYLARTYGPHGVTANAVAPAFVFDTDMGRASAAAGAELPDNHPLRRAASTSEIASVVAFLASNDSSYVTGTILDVNGGWLMR